MNPVNMFPRARCFRVLLAAALLSGGGANGAGESTPLVFPYEVASFSTPESRIDQLVFAALRKEGIEPARPCSDAVFLRRVYLDVLGLPPTAEEAEAFLKNPKAEKRAALVDELLQREEHVDYWTMRWCDLLRVKSEFPINLWPNAVQAYQRWIREAVRANRPLDEMARQLLTASGSNFRVPAVNFYRAVQGRGPQPLAAAVVQTWMGSRIESWPSDRRAGLEAFFSRLHYKATAEWKEEIVCHDPTPSDPLKAMLPDGREVVVPWNEDPRAVFASWLLSPGNRWFARAAANRNWAWIFGRGIVHEPDDLRPDNPPSVPGLLEHLEKEFAAGGYDEKRLLRSILNSRVYQLSSIPRSDSKRAAAMFAAYPVRRLEAEVLLDALCALTGTKETYQSPIPEPFTYIPATGRSVNLADASITSPFLELFGRCQRDTGRLTERTSPMSGAQRLHLLNSSHVRVKLERGPRLKEVFQSNRRDPDTLARALYMECLSRPPTAEEAVVASKLMGRKGEWMKQGADDLVWALINSKEFLHRH